MNGKRPTERNELGNNYLGKNREEAEDLLFVLVDNANEESH